MLVDQTSTMAEKLAAHGYDPFRKSTGDTWTMVGLCSGKTETVVPYRNINILPVVASANRSQLLKQMDFWSESIEQHLRYSVVTGGARCSLRDLRDRMSLLSRSVSNFAADPWLKEHGVSVVFRGSEVTVKREDDGVISCHPHANIVTSFSRRLTTEEFRAYLALGHASFRSGDGTRAHWQECGRLVKTSEVIKYPTKPCEVSCLTGPETVQLAVAMQGLHIAQAMGGFRDFRHQLDEDGEKIARICTDEKQGTFAWCTVPRATRPERDPDRVVTSDRRDMLLAILPPQPRFVDALEPILLVQNYTGDLDAVVERAGLGEPMCAALAAWMGRGELRALASTPSRQLLLEKAVHHDADELFSEERCFL